MASYYILQEMRPWIVDECRKHYWVSQALGLDAYPIIYRERIVSPRSGPFYRLFGGEADLVATYGLPR
jgi:hypothetical protein